ncbi:MAG: hypothetical protein ACTHNW_15520 [Mucilaginibacter sp.]
MSIPDLCIYFVIGILSVAYPILLQVISRLDEKYASVIIVDLFEKEIEWILFKVFLVTTLVLIACYAVVNLFANLNNIPFINQIVGYTLITSTALLIAFFLLFINKIITYYTPSKAISYLIKKKENENFEYFKALGDILYYAVEQQKEVFAKLIFSYYSKTFADFRTANNDKPIIYPDPYYQLIADLTAKLAPLNNRRFAFLEHRTVGGLWLLGEMDRAEVSEETYKTLWYCLANAVIFERDDMIMQYWSVAHQNFSMGLAAVQPNYVWEGAKATIANKAEVDKRNGERKRFLEFNHALLGLLLFKGRLSCVKRIFSYTTSSPPSYVLLPLSMTEVFNIFFTFWDAYHENFPFISFRYWYPETEGLKSEDLVKLWSCNLAALLFLRQYSIVPFYVTMQPLAHPEIPKTKSARKMWIEHLDHFKKLVENLYQDQDLKIAVGLGFLNDQWCDDNHKERPLVLIDQVKADVTEAYDRTEFEQTIAEEDLKKFLLNTERIVGETLQPYLKLFDKSVEGQYNGYVIPGVKGIMDKNPFAEDKEADYFNHYSIYAQSLADSIKEGVSNNFFFPKNTHYYVEPTDIYSAIDKLNPDPNDYVLIDFDLDLQTITNHNNIEGLDDNAYKGLKIHRLPFFGRPMDRRLVIIKKEFLPQIFLDEFPKDSIDRYHLSKLEQMNIYASITDLYRDAAIKDDVLNDTQFTQEQKHDIDKKVLIYIGMRLVIRWATNASSISISPYYSYFSETIKPTAIDDIIPLPVIKKGKSQEKSNRRN